MNKSPSAIRRLKRSRIAISVVICCLLMITAGGFWYGTQLTKQYTQRVGIVTRLIQMPEIISGKLLLQERSGTFEAKVINQDLEYWVFLHESLQTGSPDLGLEAPLDKELLADIQVVDKSFHYTIESLQQSILDSEANGAYRQQILQSIAKPYASKMSGMKEKLEAGFDGAITWIWTAQILTLLITFCFVVLQYILIDKPIFNLLGSTEKRNQTIRSAESSHMKVVRDLAIQKKRRSKASTENSANQQEQNSPLSEAYPAKVLLVEDHPANQKYVQKLFSKLGYTADMASNGREAVAKALTASYDLIFMDIQMPIMDGIQASYEILNSLDESEAPVIIALTGSAEPEIQEKCLDIGMKDIIWKPVKRDQVTEMIIKWVNVPA